jgi:catechol 2,3-dioxygenase-like lactoylglutathione lyase family enzyme
MNSLIPVISALAIDTPDPTELGRFWQHLLGGELRHGDDGDAELHGGPVQLDFLRVPDAKDGSKNRLHLDLAVPFDVRCEAIERAVALGATRADDVYDGGEWQALRDPEGNEFCIVWG